MKTALITGATGFVGRNLVHMLHDAKVHVYALVRDAAKAESIIGLDDRIEIIQCSLEDIESLPRRVPLLDDGVF